MLLKDGIDKGRQYEWLISKIFHNERYSINTKVIPDTNLDSKFTDGTRQIDILVENDKFKTMIECKNHSRPIDLKAVESFLSMFKDTSADFGILVSASGFTKSAIQRVKEFPKQITLEHIDWESAYRSAINEHTYGHFPEICTQCLSEYEYGKEVPGLLCWESGFGLEVNGKISLFSISSCLKCNLQTVYCDSCGWETIAVHEESCCDLRNEFVSCYKANK
ncbi:restriction endonuclease [Pseudoalteromonas sp. NEC-BIFX-2020_002]|uniref:restriction endonuclease n=1 Tax=Pseudoalteromonas sp. NEC-BIFX-2020_002 TaxID=2732353 RepID=UPI001476FB4D|nr:restriction endonuclease [Pseudoalteromonas sp. NEC-BIFX-2020_002]NNG42755.1 restriction endonuclease [Pseudoalteromonas sp. NEC-BIFX-2020_002]